LTEPGPFGTRTCELGSYLGVRRNGQLAAMAGERLKLPGYTEISAVCTHPEHTGHGFATRLVAEIAEGIRARGERPFLHVREDNVRATDIYRRLGFVQRLVFHLMVVGKAK
jgi:predicted GNAT family acetyltransferase